MCGFVNYASDATTHAYTKTETHTHTNPHTRTATSYTVHHMNDFLNFSYITNTYFLLYWPAGFDTKTNLMLFQTNLAIDIIL